MINKIKELNAIFNMFAREPDQDEVDKIRIFPIDVNRSSRTRVKIKSVDKFHRR